MKKLLLCYFPFLLLLSSCDSCKVKTETIYIGQDMKNYFDYRPGSYWVYKDSLTGREDSFAVIEYKGDFTEMGDVTGRKQAKREYIMINIKEYPLTGDLTDTMTWLWQIDDAARLSLTYPVYLQQYVNTNLGGMPFKPGEERFDIDCNDSFRKGIVFYPAYSLGTNAFDSVYCSYTTNPFDSCYHPQKYNRYYLTRDAGPIKIEFNNKYMHRVWELERYSIIR